MLPSNWNSLEGDRRCAKRLAVELDALAAAALDLLRQIVENLDERSCDSTTQIRTCYPTTRFVNSLNEVTSTASSKCDHWHFTRASAVSSRQPSPHYTS